MRPASLAALGLGERTASLVGTTLLARAAAIQLRRSEGSSARMQDLAALSIGTMALLDAHVTRRSASGLALALRDVASPLPAIAAGIATAADPQLRAPDLALAERLRAFRQPPPDWTVFTVLQVLTAHPDLRARFYPIEFAAAIGRDEGQPIGRLGISAYRWMRVADAQPGPQRSDAARWILERGADEAQQPMRDTFHWKNVHAGLAPVEPEQLLAALIFLGSLEDSGLSAAGRSDRPAIRSTLAVAADIMGQPDLAGELTGPESEIGGNPGGRWNRWLASTGDGPLQW